MSWRGKRKNEDAGASDGDGDGGPLAKKATKKDDDSDGITVCQLSKNRRVCVRSWQGKPIVDIREFYEKDGKLLPGKKGISLSLEQWDILRDHVEEIQKVVGERS